MSPCIPESEFISPKVAFISLPCKPIFGYPITAISSPTSAFFKFKGK